MVNTQTSLQRTCCVQHVILICLLSVVVKVLPFLECHFLSKQYQYMYLYSVQNPTLADEHTHIQLNTVHIQEVNSTIHGKMAFQFNSFVQNTDVLSSVMTNMPLKGIYKKVAMAMVIHKSVTWQQQPALPLLRHPTPPPPPPPPQS